MFTIEKRSKKEIEDIELDRNLNFLSNFDGDAPKKVLPEYIKNSKGTYEFNELTEEQFLSLIENAIGYWQWLAKDAYKHGRFSPEPYADDELDGIEKDIEDVKKTIVKLVNKVNYYNMNWRLSPEGKERFEKFKNDFLPQNRVKDVSQSTNLYEVAERVQELNPKEEIKVIHPDMNMGENDRIYSSIPGNKLKLPNGFHYNSEDGITNKGETLNGLYVSIEVKDLKEIEPEKLISADEISNYNFKPSK